ncbi:MAG TPA: MFS transporter [Pirellulales bacterium]|nr:MFS transporter [Pirellulales bacterium]
MEAGRFSRDVRASVAEGALATVMGTLLSGAFLTAFALRLGANEIQIGLLAATTSLAHVAQLAGSWAVERSGRSKPICMIASWVSRLLWLPILCVPLVLSGLSGVEQAWTIIALLTVSSLFASIGAMAWLAWIKRLIPEEMRLRFLGRRHVFNTALTFSLTVIGGLFIDAWSRWYPESLGGFIIVFAVAMSCGIIGLLILQTISEVPARPPVALPLSRLVNAPFADSNFRRLISFYAVWNFASNLATPFFAVYMLAVLQLSLASVTLLLTLSSVVGLAATRLWTRCGDRFGTRSMVSIATLADVACPLLWLSVTADNLWLLVPIHLLGVFAAPIAMGPQVLSLKHSPAENGSVYLALFHAITGPLTAAGAVVGGTIAGWNALDGAPATVAGLKTVFLISAAGRLLSLLLLRRVREPESVPVGRIVRVLHRAGRRWAVEQRGAASASWRKAA